MSSAAFKPHIKPQPKPQPRPAAPANHPHALQVGALTSLRLRKARAVVKGSFGDTFHGVIEDFDTYCISLVQDDGSRVLFFKHGLFCVTEEQPNSNGSR